MLLSTIEEFERHSLQFVLRPQVKLLSTKRNLNGNLGAQIINSSRYYRQIENLNSTNCHTLP